MDRRRKHIDPEAERALRTEFFEEIRAGRLTIGEAVKKMRRISRLTIEEFAQHRGISVGTLKQIESGRGNPSVEVLDRVGAIFGVRVGFVMGRSAGVAPSNGHDALSKKG